MSPSPGVRSEGSVAAGATGGAGGSPSPFGGAFLAGASRLLPASIPFRYFGAAVAYHRACVARAAASVRMACRRFAGGLGWPLAALHLVDAGCARDDGDRGESATVAGRDAAAGALATRCPAVIWWLYTPGVAAIALGMGMPAPRLLVGGAVARRRSRLWATRCCSRRNLIGARGMPAVVVATAGSRCESLVVVLRPRCRSLAPTRESRARARHRARACTSPSPATVSWACSRWDSRTSWCRCSRCRRRPIRTAAHGRRCALAVDRAAACGRRCIWHRAAPSSPRRDRRGSRCRWRCTCN